MYDNRDPPPCTRVLAFRQYLSSRIISILCALTICSTALLTINPNPAGCTSETVLGGTEGLQTVLCLTLLYCYRLTAVGTRFNVLHSIDNRPGECPMCCLSRRPDRSSGDTIAFLSSASTQGHMPPNSCHATQLTPSYGMDTEEAQSQFASMQAT